MVIGMGRNFIDFATRIPYDLFYDMLYESKLSTKEVLDRFDSIQCTYGATEQWLVETSRAISDGSFG
jgi:hypothetical protein